jgi:hypothetical protein
MQQWIINEIFIFSNGHHLELWVELSGIILNGDHPRNIPAKFGSILFNSFRRGDLNVIFYKKKYA